jgi:hypothetical protein
MDIKKITRKVIGLPNRFYAPNNEQSIYFLLQETGYFGAHDKVNEYAIREILSEHIEYAKQWLEWSENKRSSSGWYFMQNEQRKYVVGHYPEQENFKENEYSEIKEACAAFIKREIEDIRRS